MIEARIDLDAVAANVSLLKNRAAPAAVMAVVKADGYGHGLLPCARAALAGGADWIGVATVEEALQLRAEGIDVPMLAWLIGPDEPVEAAVGAGIDVSVATRPMLERVAAVGPARVQLKVDTGLGRGGATGADWPAFVERASALEHAGRVRVTGIWSHLAHADAPLHPTIEAQHAAFEAALGVAADAGLRPEVRHLANSAATLANPALHYDLVRPGIAIYGLSPGPLVGATAELGLRPAMRLVARVALVKRVPAGHGVSYGHRYHTSAETTLALVPAGYADGVPRAATNTAEIWLAGRRRRIAGTVCMDQFVVDMGDAPVSAGDEVVLWGAGDDGEPTADDWAAALGTINYEIVTRLGSRVQRVYTGLIADRATGGVPVAVAH